MLGVTLRHVDHQKQPAIELPVIGADANRRPNGVGAGLDHEGVQCDDLVPRHALDFAVVGDAAEKHAAIRIGKGGDLIREVLAARASRSVTSELDRLEFPMAVFGHLQLASDFLVAEGHTRASPAVTENGRQRFSSVSSLSPGQ